MIQRYDISAYCNRCGSAEGGNAVVIDYDIGKNGDWIKYSEISDTLADVRVMIDLIDGINMNYVGEYYSANNIYKLKEIAKRLKEKVDL